MKALLLSPYPERISDTLIASGTGYACTHLDPTIIRLLMQHDTFDWLISFGYRHILPPDLVDEFEGRAINLHISLLPFNRGADPNFWSWFDNTPKGVTIHQIGHGIDTGPVLTQAEIPFLKSGGHTLRTSYDILMREAANLFDASWTAINNGYMAEEQPSNSGTYHRAADKDRWMKNLPGWDATCEEVERLGQRERERLAA